MVGSPHDKQKIMSLQNVPKHIAIIMDGNGRWAKKRKLPRTFGHKAGVKAVKRTIAAAYEFGVKYLSLYVFSTENWKRPKEEVDFLMSILNNLIEKEVKELNKHKVKVKFLGFLNDLSKQLKDKIAWAEEYTDKNDKLQVNLLLNYGGRQEIINAAQKVVENKETLNEKNLEKYLFTCGIPDPELIIRTSGEYRLSNFLQWQSAYSELWITKKCWPDFNKALLQKAIEDYGNRDRRFGGLNG